MANMVRMMPPITAGRMMRRGRLSERENVIRGGKVFFSLYELSIDLRK
jgi:hypothetical protein